MARKKQMPLPGIGPIEVEIPTMDWQQIGGDMNPGAYGGTIATANGHAIELIQIQPVREYVRAKEAKDFGYPFWTKVAYFDADDLSPDNSDVQSALDSIGTDLETLEADYTPTQRAMVIAEALLDYGRGNEGESGWSKDIGIPNKVKWWDGKVAGAKYLEDEDREFLYDILLEDLDVDYESYGPNVKNPTSGLKVSTRGHTVEITEWTDIEDATGNDQPEGEKISRQDTEVELEELFDTKAKHRGSYSGDNKGVSLMDLANMNDEEREKAIVSVAIAFLAYHGGEESFVDAIGD
jgi:hypothetical protein